MIAKRVPHERRVLTFDIETLPTDDELVIAELAKQVKAPGTMSKPETIAKWHEENGAQALADLVAKTSYDGMYGRVACVAWDDGDGVVFSSLPSDSERESIKLFFDFIATECHDQTIFCGHNIAGFDLPFLKHRSIILGIKPPSVLRKAMSAKPWDNCIADTMLMWSSDSQKRASMDKLCKALGIAGKDGFDGSMVAETWTIDPNKVIQYCKDDVRRTIEIYNRIMFS